MLRRLLIIIVTLITFSLLINVNSHSGINATLNTTLNQTNSTNISLQNPIDTKTGQEIIPPPSQFTTTDIRNPLTGETEALAIQNHLTGDTEF